MLGPLTFRAKQEKVASSPARRGETEGDKLTEDAGSNDKNSVNNVSLLCKERE